MLAYRRDKNLCDILVNSKTAMVTNTGGGEDQYNCRVCQAVEKGEVYDVAGNKTNSTIPNPKCTLPNVVYALLCDKCKMAVYVGGTERSVKERVSEHKKDIKNQAEKPIMIHFSGHKVDDMHFMVLQSLGRERRAYRQLVEEKWIIRPGTKTPFGCNVQLNF